jgi:hypothetical protein
VVKWLAFSRSRRSLRFVRSPKVGEPDDPGGVAHLVVRPTPGAGTGGYRNTLFSASDGFLNPIVCRARPLSSQAMWYRSVRVGKSSRRRRPNKGVAASGAKD